MMAVYKPMLDRYKGKYMLAMHSINNGPKGPTDQYQNCHTRQILTLDG